MKLPASPETEPDGRACRQHRGQPAMLLAPKLIVRDWSAH